MSEWEDGSVDEPLDSKQEKETKVRVELVCVSRPDYYAAQLSFFRLSSDTQQGSSLSLFLTFCPSLILSFSPSDTQQGSSLSFSLSVPL